MAVGFILRSLLAERPSRTPETTFLVFSETRSPLKIPAVASDKISDGFEAFSGCNHTYTVVTVHVHVLQRCETVEPSIGYLFDNLFFASFSNFVFKVTHGRGSFSTKRLSESTKSNLFETLLIKIQRASCANFLIIRVH